jgi:hypothetical protein
MIWKGVEAGLPRPYVKYCMISDGEKVRELPLVWQNWSQFILLVYP